MLHRLQNKLLSKVMFWANWGIDRQIGFILGKNESKNLQEILNNIRDTVGHAALKKICSLKTVKPNTVKIKRIIIKKSDTFYLFFCRLL